MKTEFVVAGDGGNYQQSAEEFETVFDIDSPEWMAEDAAKHFYENNDGWESLWPVFFELYVDGAPVGVFQVDIEFDPTFSASPSEAEQARIWGLFHPMPNTAERERLYQEWLRVRRKIDSIIYR